VLIHCSDGWDRTSQLSALSQLCLDPFYRTLDGFIILIEKDWLSFGHMFAHRSGHLSSEKWFHIENERVSPESGRSTTEKSNPANALENAFLSAKGFFKQDNNKSRDSLVDSDSELNPMDPEYSPSAKRVGSSAKSPGTEKHVTKVKETAPIFHQFLDATYQLLYQYPTRFEFNERFLRRLLYHLYSCQYGTFLYNSEKERRDANVQTRTRSVWEYFLARREQFLNPSYDSTINDNERGKERLIFPKPEKVRWWNEVFGRSDAEMNGMQPPGPDSSYPTALTGVETAHQAIGPGAVGSPDKQGRTSPSPVNGISVQNAANAASQGIAGLGLGSSTPQSRGEQDLENGQQESKAGKVTNMELELQ
jgi:myotubularin-related protein 6/7/8